MMEPRSNTDEPADAMDAAVAEISGWLGQAVTMEQEIPGVASPVHRAVDAAVRVARTPADGQSFILKVWHKDLLDPPDPVQIFDMTLAAAAIGVTPLPRLKLKTTDAVLFDHLPEGWKTARLHEIATEDGLARLIATKRSINRLAPFPVDRDVFDDIQRLATKVRPLANWLPAETDAMISYAAKLGQAIAASGVDRVPAHADGITSNVMQGPDGAIQLVDFDEAGNADPLFDLAVVLNEVYPLDEARHLAVLETIEGSVHTASRARLRAYAFADDLKWALWGFGMDASSPRRGVEFLKYAQWRWLRCQMASAPMEYEEIDRHV